MSVRVQKTDPDESKLILSELCQAVMVDGHRFEIEIYRLEEQDRWTLEVIDFEGSSYVWDDKLGSDFEAKQVAVETLNNEGAAGFIGNELKP